MSLSIPGSMESPIVTMYNKLLYKQHCLRSQKLLLIHGEPLKEDSLSIKDKTAELFPMCPLFGGSTVSGKSLTVVMVGGEEWVIIQTFTQQ